MIEIILFIKLFIILIATGIGAWTDCKTGYIYNWITFPLIILGLLLLILESFILFNLGWFYFLKVFIIGSLIYGIGYLFYYFGKLGGGDVKLFLGIHLLVPYVNGQLLILWVLILSSLLSVLIVSIKYLFILFKKITFTEFKKIIKTRTSKMIIYLLMFIFFVFLLYSAIYNVGFSKYYFFLLIPIFIGLLTVLFEEEIKKYIYLKRKALRKIEEGDVLAIEFLSKELLNKLNMGNRQVIEEKDLLIIKNLDVKSLPIYDNLPRFGPYILLGFIFAVLYLFFLF
ncbi:MAG: A24 family peptidase [Candidatus ainarchaeum sp.]|nr:A24 family peptidase [Candidatus ainarchaeum sp.]